MAEKLENPSFSKDEVKEIPSLALVTGIIEKIKVYVDYKQAILNQKIFEKV